MCRQIVPDVRYLLAACADVTVRADQHEFAVARVERLAGVSLLVEDVRVDYDDADGSCRYLRARAEREQGPFRVALKFEQPYPRTVRQ